jgi:hypothetical protein
MADEQQADPDKPLKTSAPAQDTPHGDDWGADWESAFQAEEFLVDEAEADTSLAEAILEADEDESPAVTIAPGSGAGVDEKTGPAVTLGGEGAPVARKARPSLFAGLLARCRALPRLVRLAVPVALLLLLTGTLLTRFVGRHGQDPIPSPATQQATAPVATEVPAASPPEPAVDPAPAVAPAAEPPAPETAAPPQEEKTSTPWPLSAFIIPVLDETTKATLFVTVELSLDIALSGEKKVLPLDKKPFVRDIIFQFFANRPLFDLRHYAMAHGEMSAQLIDWLRKQWPDGDIAGLNILSYKID